MSKAKGAKQFRRPSGAREAALQILHAVEEEGSYANIGLNRVFENSDLGKQDRGLATELVYGTIKQRARLDWVIGRFLSRPMAKLDSWIRDILRLGAYQLLHADRIPVSAAVNESVKLAKLYGHQGTAGLVNGVLRNIDRNRSSLRFPSRADNLPEALAVEYSHPRWLVQKWLEEMGPGAAEELCQANNIVPPLTVRTNTLKVDREGLQAVLAEDNVSSLPTPYAAEGLIMKDVFALAGLKAFRQGLFQVQDESSMLVAGVMKPKPGDLIMDVCSAPGGKTTHMAQLMENKGRIVALDIHPHKLALVEDNCRRLGIDIVETRAADALQLPGEWAGQADGVLVDAPCSGLGVLRRRPEIRWRQQQSAVTELAQLQQQLLAGAAQCVKPGGSLVYSTCTVTPEENREVAAAFSAANPGFIPVDLTPFLPAALLAAGNLPTATLGYIQLMPHLHGTDGFFIARWERKV